MKTGYPRYVLFCPRVSRRTFSSPCFCSFFIHKSIEAFADAIVTKYASPAEKAFLFPSHQIAERCSSFLYNQVPTLPRDAVKVLDFYPKDDKVNGNKDNDGLSNIEIVSAVIFPPTHSKVAKSFWQHSGDGISSRRAEYCHKAFERNRLIVCGDSLEPDANEASLNHPSKGPRRYQKKDSVYLSPMKHPPNGAAPEGRDCVQFVEERYGRNLDVSLASSAKLAIRRRIAGALTANVDLKEALEMVEPPTRTEFVKGFSEDDVYLYPTGMSSIFNTHRSMLACRGQLQSISFG